MNCLPEDAATRSRVVALLFALALLTAGFCKAQPQETSPESDLKRLSTLPSEQLLACFDDWKICGVGEGMASGWPISDELAQRGDPRDLLARYWKEQKWTIRDGIEHVAYHFDSEEVTLFMRRVISEHVKDGEDQYWPVNYLAKKGDATALKELATGRYRDQGCLQYETSVALFGKWKYRPAIPYLVGTALYDECLNIPAAAEASLREMYPDSPQFDQLEQMQRYFCGRAKKDGFRVKCNEK
jgi:hypothetical protein